MSRLIEVPDNIDTLLETISMEFIVNSIPRKTDVLLYNNQFAFSNSAESCYQVWLFLPELDKQQFSGWASRDFFIDNQAFALWSFSFLRIQFIIKDPPVNQGFFS